MNDIACPYCDHVFQIDTCEHDLQDESEGEETCPECRKNFAFTASIHWYFASRKADCLNGSPHNFTPWDIVNTVHTASGVIYIEVRICELCKKQESRIIKKQP